jgi:uncharacterized membrane protein YvlD (DUF360 family)
VRRFEGRHAVVRVLVVWVITAATLHLLSGLLGGLSITGWTAAFGAAAWIGILNALVWPAFIRLALPITVLTLGFGTLALNGFIVWASQELVDGFTVSNVGTGVVIAIVLTVVNTLVTAVLAIDDDDFYYRNVVRRAARRRGAIESDVPAVAFLEIDGLAHDILAHAIRNGDVPTMARWLRNGSHRLIRWETDWSSQTGASQAGLLHGRNDEIPAFRWWDKELGAPVASSAPRDVMAIEARISDGTGLLHADGASRANMFSGRVEGEDPLLPFGPLAARKVKRTDGFVHCADLMINGAYFADVDAVAAFEELVGSHGGMGGAQGHAFALVPSELELPGEPLLGAESVHHQLRRWLAELGHDEYRDGLESLVAPGLGAGEVRA